MFDWLPSWALGRKAGEQKSAIVGDARFALMAGMTPRWTGRNFASLAQEGFAANVVAHRCTKLVAEGAALLPWQLYDGDHELRQHPVLDLLYKPSPLQDGAAMMESVYAFLLLAGNAYLQAVPGAGDRVGALYVLRPDRMRVVADPHGWPVAFEYRAGGEVKRYPHAAEGHESPILHLKAFHPLDDHYGFPPLAAAGSALDTHNVAGAWNKALLDNAARPSGALIFDGGDQQNHLSEAQFDRLKSEMQEQFQGAANAGRPLLLEGGLSWQGMALSPAEMDFIAAKHLAAREIALALGVPPLLLGIPGDNTYANYQEANRALWRQTILPLVDRVTAALNSWLMPHFGTKLRLSYDTDKIDALAADREALWARVSASDFLSRAEKRTLLGFSPQPDIPDPS